MPSHWLAALDTVIHSLWLHVHSSVASTAPDQTLLDFSSSFTGFSFTLLFSLLVMECPWFNLLPSSLLCLHPPFWYPDLKFLGSVLISLSRMSRKSLGSTFKIYAESDSLLLLYLQLSSSVPSSCLTRIVGTGSKLPLYLYLCPWSLFPT